MHLVLQRDPAELLTLNEVAALLRVSQETVRRHVRQGELKAVRLGHRTVRFRRTDVDTFLRLRSSGEGIPE